MIRKDSGRPSTGGRRPLLLTFVGNNRHMLTEIRDNLSHLRKNDSEGSELSNLHRRPELSQSTPNLLEKSAGCKMTRSDSQHHKALAEIRDSLRPYQNVCSGTANSVSGSSGVGSSDNSSSASSTSSHATSDADHYINKVQRIMQYGFDEDVAVHALLLSRDQTVESALRLLSHIRARSAVGDPGSGLFRASYNQPPSSLNSSGSNSVRSDSPTLTHTPPHPMLVSGLVSPPTLPPRAPITTQANQTTPTFPNKPCAARSHNAIGQKPLTAQSSVLLQPFNQDRDQMRNQGRDQLMNQGRDQMLNQGRDWMFNQGRDQMFNQGRDQMFNQGRDQMFNQGRDQQMNQGRDQMMDQGRDQMMDQGRDQMLNQGRDQMLNQGRDQMLNQGRDQMLNQARDQLADRTQDETLAGGQSNIIPHGHVQQMIQRMSPGWTHQQQQQQMTQVKNNKETRPVASQESVNSLTDSKQPVIPGTSHNGITPDRISLVSQQLQNIMLDAHNFAPNSTSTTPTRDSSAKLSGQAPPTSYNQARLQVAMVKGVRVTPGPEVPPSTYREPLLDFHRAPQAQGVPAKTNNPEIAQNKIVTSAGVPAMAMGLHMPVIMPCVRSKEVTKPMPQTATAPLAPPANRGITHNQFPQDKSYINIIPSSLPQQHQDHQQRGRLPGNDFEIPLTHSSNGLQMISDGRRYTLEQHLAPQSSGHPLFQQQSTNQVFHNHIQALHNTTFPHEATTFTPLPDSHISRATAYSPVSVISTTSTPSTNSDVPESAPQTASSLNLRSQPHINPPLLPPRIPLKDQPSYLPANNSEQVSHFGAPLTLSKATFPQTSSSLQPPSLTKDTFSVPTSLQNTPISLPSNTNTLSSRTNLNNAPKDGLPHLTLPYPADSTPQTNESSDTNLGQNYSSAKCSSCLTQEKHRCMSPLPQRKSDARERDKLLCDTKVRVYSTQAFKFYMEQHVENVLKSCAQRMDRRLQLEKEMAKVRLSEEAADEMRKMLHKKESNYIRLKRAKMDSSMFEKIQTLGVGAFGEVALVRKKDVGSLYAMKTLKKSNVIKRNQVAHVKAERDILAEADNEWVVKLYYSFQDRDYLYFVMDYVPGGDLMGLLIRTEILEEHLARFYIAELVLAIESVHKMGFIHRDIKPDNILIDRDGHIKLTDFGLCTGFRWTHNSKYYQKDGTHSRQDSMDVGSLLNDQHGEVALKPLEQRRQREQQRYLAYSLVGTPNYIAPEVLLRSGCTKACDWWSVGVILYEMVIGRPPFYAATSAETQYKVINWKETLSFRHCTKISHAATCLIVRLLQGPETRLGRNGANEVKEHQFFADINFPGLRQQSAPLKPTIRYLTDTSNFDPVEPDNLLRNDSGGSRKFDSKLDSGKQSDHAFFEFTFRRFFDDGGHPCAVSVQNNPESNSPVYV